MASWKVVAKRISSTRAAAFGLSHMLTVLNVDWTKSAVWLANAVPSAGSAPAGSRILKRKNSSGVVPAFQLILPAKRNVLLWRAVAGDVDWVVELTCSIA